MNSRPAIMIDEPCVASACGWRRRQWIMACTLGAATLVAELPMTARDEKSTRLGFSFDQKAHDAATATGSKGEDATDAPPPGVVRLPRVKVTEKPMSFSENELLTPRGRLATAKKRYLNPAYQKTIAQVEAVATFLNNPLGGWQPNGPEAMALYWDDEQKKRNGEMKDLVGLEELAHELAGNSAKKPAHRK